MKNTIDINSNKRSFFLPLQILAASAVIASCAPVETKVEQTDLFFPPPPDPARYVFERTVTGSASLLVEDDDTKMRRLLTGEGMSTLGFSKPFDVTANGACLLSMLYTRTFSWLATVNPAYWPSLSVWL